MGLMTLDDIDFFLKGKANFSSVEFFKKSWTYLYFTELYGEMIYIPDSDFQFIGIDKYGNCYDEVYTKNKDAKEKIGNFIPKNIIGKKKPIDSELWNSVSKNGYSILEYKPHNFINNKIHNLKFQKSSEQDNSVLIQEGGLPYQIYDLAKYVNKSFEGPLVSKNLEVDALKYLKGTHKDTKGPYRFHMDFCPNLYYMFFNYYTKSNNIEGRELVISKRKNLNLDQEINKEKLCTSGETYDEKIISIKDNMVILINSYNPLFVHKVNPMKSDSEVILFTNYLYI